MEPVTREERLMDGQTLEPITREERILAGEDLEVVTRREWFLKKYRGGGGGDITVESLNVTENGTYTAPTGKAYSPVKVEVPATPPTPLDDLSVTANGTYTPEEGRGFNEVTVAVEGYAKKSIQNTPTAIATFNASALPMPSLTVGIEAVQSGTGDPSPTNVRHISGWSAVNVYDTGKNLFDKVNCGVYNGYIAGTQVYGSPNHRTIYIPCKPNTTYSSANFSGNGRKDITYSSEVPIGGLVVPTPLDTITTDANAKYLLCYCYNANNDTVTFDDVKNALEIVKDSTTPSTYEPYAGTTYTTQLKDGQDNPLTCYGGTLSNENGVQRLTNEKVIVDAGDLTWTKDTTTVPNKILWVSPNIIGIKPYGTNNLCSSYKYVGNYNNLVDKSCAYIYGYKIAIQDSTYDNTTEADFKTAMSGVKLLYELETPQTISQDSLSIATQEGTNNLWADSGDIQSGEYLEAL